MIVFAKNYSVARETEIGQYKSKTIWENHVRSSCRTVKASRRLRMPTPEDAKQRAASTYNAAADAFDESPLSFWDYFGKKTVDKLSLATGARVLDVCCGSGASAFQQPTSSDRQDLLSELIWPISSCSWRGQKPSTVL
jgi:hypothetical protein